MADTGGGPDSAPFRPVRAPARFPAGAEDGRPGRPGRRSAAVSARAGHAEAATGARSPPREALRPRGGKRCTGSAVAGGGAGGQGGAGGRAAAAAGPCVGARGRGRLRYRAVGRPRCVGGMADPPARGTGSSVARRPAAAASGGVPVPVGRGVPRGLDGGGRSDDRKDDPGAARRRYGRGAGIAAEGAGSHPLDARVRALHEVLSGTRVQTVAPLRREPAEGGMA